MGHSLVLLNKDPQCVRVDERHVGVDAEVVITRGVLTTFLPVRGGGLVTWEPMG